MLVSVVMIMVVVVVMLVIMIVVRVVVGMVMIAGSVVMPMIVAAGGMIVIVFVMMVMVVTTVAVAVVMIMVMSAHLLLANRGQVEEADDAEAEPGHQRPGAETDIHVILDPAADVEVDESRTPENQHEAGEKGENLSRFHGGSGALG